MRALVATALLAACSGDEPEATTVTPTGITCESDEAGLTCSDREGHEFALARGTWSAS